MPPAARISDMHVCPMVTPGVPPIPHVGGPVSVGCPTVLIGGLPAARVGDMAICVGPPDTIAMGSMTVLIGGTPAARMGDTMAHGGPIVAGCPQVMIGGRAIQSPRPPFRFLATEKVQHVRCKNTRAHLQRSAVGPVTGHRNNGCQFDTLARPDPPAATRLGNDSG